MLNYWDRLTNLPDECLAKKAYVENVDIDSKEKVCQYCGASFSITALTNHVQKVHSTVNYDCEKCGLEFCSKYDLKQHVENGHPKLKVHICQHCGQSFSSVFNMKAHVERVHLGIKNFSCNECNWSSYEKVKLKMHKESVHLKMKEIQFQINGR